MSDKYELAAKYANRLRDAAQDSHLLLESVGSKRNSRFVQALVEVGQKVRNLEYDDGSRINDEDLEEVIELIAQELSYLRPKRLGRLLREGSVTALMAMSQSIEDLFAALEEDED